jgi:hypothetical protein
MTSSTRETGRARESATNYRIRVADVLGEEWSERANGMTVSVRRSEPDGRCTELYGELADEAALMGVLKALYDHGARLLSVERGLSQPGHDGQEQEKPRGAC